MDHQTVNEAYVTTYNRAFKKAVFNDDLPATSSVQSEQGTIATSSAIVGLYPKSMNRKTYTVGPFPRYPEKVLRRPVAATILPHLIPDSQIPGDFRKALRSKEATTYQEHYNNYINKAKSAIVEAPNNNNNNNNNNHNNSNSTSPPEPPSTAPTSENVNGKSFQLKKAKAMHR